MRCDPATGWSVVWHDVLDSTNEEARRWLAAGASRPVWIAARSQTAGRGRLGRSWLSPPGNLYATALFPVAGGPKHALRLPFAIGLAAAMTVRTFAPQAAIGLKWPNDVRAGRAKLAGILVETMSEAATLWAMAGIGINIAFAPEGTGQPATCLAALGAPAGLDAETVLCELASRIPAQIERAGTDFDAVLADWLGLAEGLGERVRVTPNGAPVEGVFEGLAPDGALHLRRDDGTLMRVTAGDVRLVEERS